MGVGRGSRVVKRTHWIAVFGLLLCTLSAAPVLAESEPASEPTAPASPSSDKLAEALAKAEQEQREEEQAREEELASPQAEQERDASREAFSGLSRPEAQQLLVSTFTEQLNELDADPARILSDLDINETLGTNAVRISNDDGENEVIESPIPVESKLPGEDKEPVDLALVQVRWRVCA